MRVFPPTTNPPADPKSVLEKNGVDPYVFLRFLRMLVKALVPIWLISWVALLPANSVGNSVNVDGLDRFTFGNVSKNHQSRYWVHLVLVYLFNGGLLVEPSSHQAGSCTS